MSKALTAFDWSKVSDSIAPIMKPMIFYGEGTPDGDAYPFSSAPLGSLYIDVNGGSTQASLYVKTAESSSDSDWASITKSFQGSIITSASTGASAAYFK